MDDLTPFTQTIQAHIDADIAACREHGWPVDERSADTFSIGDLIATVLAVDDEEDARWYYAGYVAYLKRLPAERKSGRYIEEQVARMNIGWCFGEGMTDERIAMWRRVCGAYHPIFGAMEPGTRPSAEQAYDAGWRLAQMKG